MAGLCMKEGNERLTPKGRRLRVKRHFHDPHKQVSSLFFACPPIVPRYQTYGQGLV